MVHSLFFIFFTLSMSRRFPSFASIYITFSSTPSRFDHSPISSRDHERAYFVLEIQMARHFFFFATKGLLGAIDPIDGGTNPAQPFSLLVHQDRLDSGTSPFLPFAAQKTTAFKPTCAGAPFSTLGLCTKTLKTPPEVLIEEAPTP